MREIGGKWEKGPRKVVKGPERDPGQIGWVTRGGMPTRGTTIGWMQWHNEKKDPQCRVDVRPSALSTVSPATSA
jgi:hypothetical protein